MHNAAPTPADPAKSAAIMLAVAAVLILIGTVSKSWLTAGSGNVHIGPLGIEACVGSTCVSVPTRGVPGDLELVMMLAVISGFASAALAGLIGFLALTGKRDKVPPPKLANIAFGLAAFSMVYFLIRGISENGELSWAGFPAIAGVILAGTGLKKLIPFLPVRSQPQAPAPYAQAPHAQPPYGQSPAQQSQPMQPQMAPPHAPPPPQQAVPGCPRCGTPLHFVAQYQRWFCPREQQYV